VRKVVRIAVVACVVALFCVPVAGAGPPSHPNCPFFCGLRIHSNAVPQAVSNPACVRAFTVPASANDVSFALNWTIAECIQSVTSNADGTQSFSGLVVFTDSQGNSLFARLTGTLRVTDRCDLAQSSSGRITMGTGFFAGAFGPLSSGGGCWLPTGATSGLSFLMKVGFPD
jgi:hypothetical protein